MPVLCSPEVTGPGQRSELLFAEPLRHGDLGGGLPDGVRLGVDPQQRHAVVAVGERDRGCTVGALEGAEPLVVGGRARGEGKAPLSELAVEEPLDVKAGALSAQVLGESSRHLADGGRGRHLDDDAAAGHLRVQMPAIADDVARLT